MRAFRFFDPWSALENATLPTAPAKVANPAKAGEASTLAALAGLASGAHPADCVSPGPNGEFLDDALSAGDAPQNGEEPVPAAKVAKAAKAEVDATADPISRCHLSKPIRQDCGNELRTESQLVAPGRWFAPYLSRRTEEPPYDQPCPERRGRDEYEGRA